MADNFSFYDRLKTFVVANRDHNELSDKLYKSNIYSSKREAYDSVLVAMENYKPHTEKINLFSKVDVNAILAIAQDLFRQRKYTEEMLVRGMMHRLEVLAENDENLRNENEQLKSKLGEVEFSLSETIASEQAKKQRILALEREKDFLLHGRYIWTTEDGRKLTPDQFHDAHLLNTIRFIEREGQAEGSEIYKSLLAEARKRKLLLTNDKVYLKTEFTED